MLCPNTTPQGAPGLGSERQCGAQVPRLRAPQGWEAKDNAVPQYHASGRLRDGKRTTMLFRNTTAQGASALASEIQCCAQVPRITAPQGWEAIDNAALHY